MRDFVYRLVAGLAWRPLPAHMKGDEDHALRRVFWLPIFLPLIRRWRTL